MRSFSESLRWGQAAEVAVGDWLRQLGWKVIRLADIKTHRGGPRAEGIDDDIVLADLMAIKDGETKLAEVKFKDHPEFYRNGGDFRHGIDTPYWNNYLRLTQESGAPGYLFIVEYRDRDEGIIVQRLLCQSFAVLERHLLSEDGANRLAAAQNPDFPLGGVFWATRHFQILGTLPRHFGLGLGDTVTDTLNKALRAQLAKTAKSSTVAKLCPVCGRAGFLGVASNPSVHYCPDHAPGLNAAVRSLYRNAITRVVRR